MPGIAVAVLSEDREQLNVLQNRLDSTNLGRIVLSHLGFPSGPTDPILRQIQDLGADVALVDINPQHPQGAITAIELIHGGCSEVTIFGEFPITIVTAIVSPRARASARKIDP